MKSRSVKFSAIVLFFAAAVLTWRMLTMPLNNQSLGPGGRALRTVGDPAHRSALAVGSERSTEPELPREAGPAPATDPAARLRNTLRTAVVKEAKWATTPLSQAIVDLRKELDVDFIIRSSEEKTVTMHLRDVSLRELLKTICDDTGMRYEIQPNAIVLQPADAALSMETKTFRISERIAANMANSQQAKDVLEEAGINMPEGSIAAVDAQSGRLIVKTIPGEYARIENFLETGNPDAPFEWLPVLIGQREYVSADKVRRFYAFTQAVPGTNDAQDTITFRSPPLEMQWHKNDRAIRVGGVEFVLKQAVVEHEGGWWISRADLSRILEPVLRPAP